VVIWLDGVVIFEGKGNEGKGKGNE